MAEEIVESTADEQAVEEIAEAAAPPVVSEATPTVDATGTNSENSGRTFTQADVNRIVKERLSEAKEKAKADSAKSLAERETEWKAQLDKAASEREAAQAQAQAHERALWQVQTATKLGLPLPLADRLKGDTLKELEADAKSMLDALPKAPPPNINAGNGNGAAPAAGQISDAEKVELAARFGVDPKYM